MMKTLNSLPFVNSTKAVASPKLNHKLRNSSLVVLRNVLPKFPFCIKYRNEHHRNLFSPFALLEEAEVGVVKVEVTTFLVTGIFKRSMS
ncbi:hypothetical protein F8M41_008808 [Gigaspora margarita]|uniref:Uncharacterized protein n=1 Tax=Gigaspora margarita TaxID=4874 RepID=A0A8H3X4J5_GIGMA|nr:hypothetical protein F8M41_008808 [Gigaspora margarita]